VALSGDATLASSGAITIANDAVEQAMIADDAVGADQLASNAVVDASVASGAAIDAAKIANGNVSNTEFQALDGVSSAIQTQLDAKTTLAAVYPVGSIYINASDATNPSSLLGFGTWEAFGEGKVPVGKASSGTFGTVGATPGAETDSITLTDTNLPPHAHGAPNKDCVSYSSGQGLTTDSFTINTYCDTNGNSTTRAPLTTDEIFNSSGTDLGSATAFTVDVVQPSVVVYMWRRTA
jgi:hypothetical protein